uniref:Uncharacterized protein n=1 Tax=Cannabis sativa TaxID=3483 RepID=A0A803R084_CANSA
MIKAFMLKIRHISIKMKLAQELVTSSSNIYIFQQAMHTINHVLECGKSPNQSTYASIFFFQTSKRKEKKKIYIYIYI